jgi:lipoprotein-anchoring transpeptidase ErfK/SrfK
MNRRSVAYLAALALSTSLSTGAALAQSYPPGSQIYRDAPAPGYRGLPPSWLVDDEDQPLPPPAGYRPSGQQMPPPVAQQNATPQQQPPVANIAPGQDALRPPAGLSPAAPVPQAGAPVTTSSLPSGLPPEDQPETGAPKALPENLQRQLVDYASKEPAGTIVIDTAHTYLYLTLGGGKALRYGIGVGRDGFTWAGTERVSRMKEWPDWFPPSEMIDRQPYLPRMMAGGDGNPLGARALYLGNTLYRIHGTNQPSTIGQFVSSGCIRLLNKDIEDLYSRVQVGTRVVVLPGAKPPAVASAQKPTSVMTIGQEGVPAQPAAPVPAGHGNAPQHGAAISSAPLPAVR